MTAYAYPKLHGRYEPFKHQREIADFLAARRRAFNFSDIGTGKTFAAQIAADRLFRTGDVRRCLIIAPLSTLDHVWAREWFKSFPGYKVEVLTGARARRIKLLEKNEAHVYIINPDGLHIVADHAQHIDLVIVDEQTEFKSHKTRRFKALKRLVGDDRRLWMMSGEPMPQTPLDIWAPASLVCPNDLPNFYRFKDKTMIKVSQFRWVNRPNAEEYIASIVGHHAIRFTRDECVDIPPTQYDEKMCKQSQQQLQLTVELKREAVAEAEDGQITAMNEAVHINKLLQAACGAVKYVDNEGNDRIHWVNVKSKLNALTDILNSTRGPAIVYCPFVAPMMLLETWFKRTNVTYRTVHGGTPAAERTKAFDAVQNGEVKVLLANPAAMQYRITLTESNTVIWWGLVYSRKTYGQACGRIQRPGQERKQYVLHLINSHPEQVVLRRLQEAEKMQGALLEILQLR